MKFIDRMRLRNYRCFQHLDVKLRPFTVLIGANDSGKSAFLSAIQQFATGDAFAPADYFRCDTQLGSRIELWVHGVGGFSRGPIRSHRPDLTLQELIAPVGYFRIPSEGLKLEGQGTSSSAMPPALDERGESLPALLDYLLRKNRSQFESLVSELRQYVPGLDDLNIGTPQPATRSIEFRIEKGVVLPFDRVSVGVRAMLFYLAIAYHPQPPKVILIEEPENGLHPGRLESVVALLRNLTRENANRPASQVIMTTHSPLLLDSVHLEENQVLVFRRQPDGSRTAEPVDANRLKIFLDEFKLGEVWLNQEEDGLVAKKP